MANYYYGENAIEWLRGQDSMILSLSEPDLIKDIVKMSKEDSNVEIIGKDKYTLCARMPRSYMKLKKPSIRRKRHKKTA